MFEGLFQPIHLLLVVVIALLIFGPGKLPQLGEGLGKSIREFKKALAGSDEVKPIAEKAGEEEKKEAQVK
ncbi:MAG: twin-arginine translocase TatA/TatE family subunit [Nitrospiraceae bacterium]|nr:twin-arginine translocase TatA/TatE family subunit [Nitrospiraceae bacterium]MDA8325015.1 twin-arginine translocase TatA/TatE family subunit [Nitrospiraceae bacterium]